MSAPIPYTVQSGETLQDIAQKLGIKDWTKLKEYHNAHSATQVGNTPYTGFSLMTPPPDEVYQLNGETPPPDPAEEQKTAEQKQEEEKKQEEEEKKNEKASKSEHYGKYLVVHGAKCVCDKAENPAQTADLQVTTHSIIILNDAQGKLAATEEDKTFNPPAATFGKCKLKPSSGGYLPCAVAPAPKWGKTYDSTQVMGKNTLTEISELQCTVGGKITISKHGQTDSISNAHAENTNPVALGMVNPAIEQPKKKEEYPSVTSIVLTQIENRITFKEIDSKNKSGVVYLRKDEEASFKANLKSGNKQLTSWMIYSDHQGKKENRIFLREQIGTEFSQSLEGYGKFRIEGYGKPKTPEFEKGKYDKCDPSCSIDVEVIENTLLDLESASGDFTTRIDPSKNRKFRRGVPSVFKAKFFIPDLTEEEKSRLTLTVLDASGNAITEGVHVSGDTLTFTPQNTKAKYTVLARYINENGEAIEKKMSGESEGNAVLGISHGAEIVRPGTSMSFSVSKMKYNFGDDNSPFGITPDESSEIKWNLDGVLIGNGKSITIPGARVTPGKHVVEAYSMVANATGKNAKKEDDDWHFEVKENDVVSFSINGTPKVGKPLTATVDKMIFPDLLPGETIYWQGFSNAVTGKSVTFTPKTPGTLTITSRIKGKGSTQKITVVQPAINDIQFTDNNGNKIEKAGWGQKINIWIDQKGLDNEKLTIVLWDSDTIQDDPVKTITVNAYDGGLIPVTLDASMRNKTGDQGSIYVKISAPELVAKGEGQVFPKTYKLNVQDKKEIFNAKLGSEDGKEKHTVVDYDEVSFFYANSRGITPKENLYLEIRDSVLGRDPLLLHQANVKADQNGVIKQKIIWNNIKNKVNLLTVYAIIKEKDKDGKVLYDADGDYSMATAKLKKGSTLVKLVENKGAVKVGDEKVPQQNTGTCVCKTQYKDLVWGEKVSCEFRKKVIQICAELWGENRKMDMANGLMAVMNVETRGSFKAQQLEGWRSVKDPKEMTIKDFWKDGKRKSSRAVGLIQFTQDALQNNLKEYKSNSSLSVEERFDELNKLKLQYAQMGEIKQLDKVKKYFESQKDSIKSPEDIYLSVFAPIGVGKNDDYILYQKYDDPSNNKEKTSNKNYQANKSVDEENNNDKKIQRSEILGRYNISFTQGSGNKPKTFNCENAQTPPQNSIPGNKWHDPIDNPMLCLYTQNGNYRPRYNVFGTVRKERSNHNHQGIDLLALPGSNAYACVDAYVEFISVQSGYGNVICLKVKEPKEFLKRKREFNLQYSNMGEIQTGAGFSFDGDFYLFYAHLQEVDKSLKAKQEVSCGAIIGKNGTSGYGQTKDPHLHFEIRSSPSGSGLSNRCHPGIFVYYKDENTMSQKEKDYQKEVAQKFWD
ncbi:PAAR-like protein [Chryseobacterium sp. NRRL B-14859]|uniref:PAAR-like protein n=1 Tax=Chryseobacterium sp. NRRL B-14859 TaxID=1562763 RepID=UPI003399DD8A